MMSEHEQEAFMEGYKAGWEFHMGNGTKTENPYDDLGDESLYNAWQMGFTRAGDDS